MADPGTGISKFAPTPGLDVEFPYDPNLLLRVLEEVSEGKLLSKITLAPGLPSARTIRKWIMMHPDARQAYRAARELSAESFEEEAIGMGRQISQDSSASGSKVRAFEVAMNQLRWSASRRDPARYGDARQTTVVVPVQINTTLGLGGSVAGAGTDDHPNIYQVEAKVVGEVTPEQEEQIPLQMQRDPDWRKRPRKRVLTPRTKTDE